MSFLFPPKAGPERIVEASTIYVDRDDELYNGGDTTRRDLLGHTLRRAQNLALSMYRTNPLANRIIRIHTTFMAGTGFAIGADNPDVQSVVDEFWYAERNRMDLNHRDRSRDYLIFGEAILPATPDEIGNTTVGFIDPTVVKDIHRSDRSNVILEAVELDYSINHPDRAPLRVIRADEDPTSDTVGLLTGETFAWLYDRIGAASRGTPLLLPILDWLDAYDQTLWELAERVKAVRAFFWDVEVDGGKTEIEEAQKLWGVTPPRSGSVRFRTPAMRVSATQPQIGAYEDVAAARYLLRLIATGAGVAPHWLGDPEDANRSTAESMDKPILRSLVDVQADWRMRVEQMLRYVVDQKVAVGMLPAVVQRHDEKGRPLAGDENRIPAHESISVTVPEITDDRVVEAAGALSTVLTAFLTADTLDIVDRNTMIKVIRQMLPALGVPADELPEPDDDLSDDENAARMTQALESLERESRRLSNRV